MSKNFTMNFDATQFQPIRLTDEACSNASRLAEAHPGQALRLYLEGKGCDGFYYGICFDTIRQDDHHYPQDHGVTVVVDPDTITFVHGSTVEWIDDERGQGFLVNNPHHRKFRGKFFKRQAWQDHLTNTRPSNQ